MKTLTWIPICSLCPLLIQFLARSFQINKTSSLMPARKPDLPSNMPSQAPLPRSPIQWCSLWCLPARIHLWLSKSVTPLPLNRTSAAIIANWAVKSIWWQWQRKSKPVDDKGQQTHCTFIVLSIWHLSKRPTRFNHSRSVSQSSTCLLANQNKVFSNMSAAAWSSSTNELFAMQNHTWLLSLLLSFVRLGWLCSSGVPTKAHLCQAG